MDAYCSSKTIFFNLFILKFFTTLGLLRCVWALSSCGKQGSLFTVVQGLLIVVASPVAEHRLQTMGSVVVAHKLRCPKACGVFPHQGSNPCPLHWQPDSYPLD